MTKSSNSQPRFQLCCSFGDVKLSPESTILDILARLLEKTIETNISGEDAPRKQVLCKCLPLASVGQQTNSECTSTSTSTSTPTPTLTEPRSHESTTTTTELDLDEDQTGAAWRTSLKRTVEALEVDLVQKEREAQAIKKN